MIARDRDVMKTLLQVYNWIPAVIPKRKTRQNRLPLAEMVQRQFLVARLIHSFRPQVVASLMGSYTQISKAAGVRNVIFTDSEFQHFNHRIAHPFADEIYTPECFYKDLGRKQRSYRGFHEMMFLRKRFFTPRLEVLDNYPDLRAGEYILIRSSAWNTFHDRNASGFGRELAAFIERHLENYKILVSAEENRFAKTYGVTPLSISPEDFHHLLYYAAFVLTEGASTASEAACLGVPTVYINNTEPRGYLQMLNRKYGLVECFADGGEGISRACRILSEADFPDWSAREHVRDILDHDFPDGNVFVTSRLLRY
jgi:predicted glycosyltransferase